MYDLETLVVSYNEENNIERCLKSLQNANISNIKLYDSGSDDSTLQIADKYNVKIINYLFVDWCKVYNDITSNKGGGGYSMILAADMQVSIELMLEVKNFLESTNAIKIICAPVQMCFFGKKLKYASLYPPLPFVFRRGAVYFKNVGHTEKVFGDIEQIKTINKLVHDDRKATVRLVNNQITYVNKLIQQSKKNNLRFKDKLMLYTPLMMVAMFVKSYIFQLGFLDGKAGFGYALERLVACGIQLRESMIHQVSNDLK